MHRCLLNAARGNGLHEPDQLIHERAFFERWFRSFGNAFCFVFRENFGRTNIQAAELLALIESHARIGSRQGTNGLQFHSCRDFLALIQLVASQLRLAELSSSDLEKAIHSLVDHHWLQLSRSVVVDFRFGSCQLFLPPHMSLDLARICGEAGYVYTCGRLVYVRNLEKARVEELKANLDRHLQLTHSGDYELLFHVSSASTADTSSNARSLTQADFGEADLSSLIVHLDKAYFDGQPLWQLPILLRGAGDHAAPTASPTDRRTLWVFSDQSIQFHSDATQGDARFIVVFDEQHIKYSPFYLFDENKPGWLAPVTIPHTLYSAMINITQPWSSPLVDLVDPFCGTATAAFESLQHPDVRFRGGDRDPILRGVHELNESFFAGDDGAFCAHYVLLHYMAGCDPKDIPAPVQQMLDVLASGSGSRVKRSITQAINRGQELVQKYNQLSDRNDERERFNSLISEESSVVRLAFFVSLRALRRLAKQSTVADRLQSQRKCANELRVQTALFAKWRAEARNSQTTENTVLCHGRLDSRPVVHVSYRHLKKLERNQHGHRIEFGSIGDIRTAGAILAGKSCDLIITDPPYGFNDFNDPQQTHSLAELYAFAIEAFVDALTPGGHLVISLPKHSYLGKALPYCTSGTLITNQVISAAAERDRMVYIPARSLPSPRSLYSAPYYWRSDRALKRQILHFCIR